MTCPISAECIVGYNNSRKWLFVAKSKGGPALNLSCSSSSVFWIFFINYISWSYKYLHHRVILIQRLRHWKCIVIRDLLSKERHKQAFFKSRISYLLDHGPTMLPFTDGTTLVIFARRGEVMRKYNNVWFVVMTIKIKIPETRMFRLL